MRPYSNLTTKNLELVLVIARLFAYLGFVLLLLSLILATSKYIESIDSISLIPTITILSLSMYALFGSAILAFLVAIEESFRKKVEHSVSKIEM